jgi:hypothetical protein
MKFLSIAIFVVVVLLSAVPLSAGTLQSHLDWTNTDTTNGIWVDKGPTLTGPFNMLVQLPAGTITYTDSTNAPGQTSCYRVAYFNVSGIGSWAGPVCKTFVPISSQTPGTFTVK